ncbi:tryptophan decarboxylase TDC1-like isoform X2 [Solanum stenotomum]|uniref:tryptophan decarboxylase TDC1-like isoform X1 n=1 Tax=Solanum stenotomum TaxID=172797 RepID=UPI0020CFF554|nr:tryptophan decarboxylase TDC1-like isoform X1 [Solanum stenotomum]XP_049413742.1 tryptophan decarboxylase TDC1-like isoform X2 [Solanum stenotomum]
MGSLDSNNSSQTQSNVPKFNPLDPEVFRTQAHQMVDFIADYYKNIETYPVLSQVEPGYLRTQLPENAPYCPESFDSIMKDVQNHIVPGMTHWLSPNFFAYFPATVSSAAFIGEMLCNCFNSVGFNWLASPAMTELEMIVMDWLANMLKLPKTFMFSGTGGGVLQSTTSEAILCTLIAARDRKLDNIGADNIGKLIVYGSDQTHSTYTKACKVAGILPCNIRAVQTSIESDFALSPVVLRGIIEADVAAGLVPLFLCATVGTTSTTAVDPLSQLGQLAEEFDIWFHVDAAYGGSACICPEFRRYLDGIERANSLSLSPHKWLLSYLDCCCMWVREPNVLVKALSTNPEYLRNKRSEYDSVVDYKDWQIGTGRKFKSLRLWLVMRSYGVANLQSHIRSDVRMAKMFEGFVRSDPRFEVVVPRRFSLVCFRFNPNKEHELVYIEFLNKKLLDSVNSTGLVYMTHTIVGGIYMLRFAVGATLTEDRHVISAWKLIKESAEVLLRRSVF